MLLQRLCEYAERLDLPPTLYSETPVRYVIELDGEGRLLRRRPIDTADPSSPRTRRGQRQLMPQVQRSSAVKPLLLADNAEYTLGLARPESRPARVAECHRAYRELVSRCAAETGEPAVQAVQRFLDEGIGSLEVDDDFDRGALVTFRVDGVFPTDLPAVQAFWASVNDPSASSERPVARMACVVCGQERPVLERLQGKLKGVPGGQTAGTAIISANSDAFESYGLSASLVAPTCASCGEKFTKAANALLADPRHRVILGGAAFIFWTREPVDLTWFSVISNPDAQEVARLIESVRSGRRVPEIDEVAFYATVLSGSGGRAVVRDWIDTTVGEVRRHFERWFSRQAIVGPYGEAPRPLGLFALAAATVRDASKDLAPPTTRALLHAAIEGTPLPLDLLYQAVRRNRAEQRVTRERAALIKLALLSQRLMNSENDMVQLDPESSNPAYRCGRLLAVLEEAQRLAVPGINATIVDRFFGTASSAPASVFPRLIRGAQPHLAKLRRDRRGAHDALQRRLEEIQGGLSAFPKVLSLEDQGWFALGYYHQRAWDRLQAREAIERRRAQTGAPADSTFDDTSTTEDTENEQGE